MESEKRCSLKKCIQGTLKPNKAHVEVKTFELPDEEKGHMEVLWKENGEAIFHDICWKAIVDSFKMDNPFILSPREKELIKEARKTAEFFDTWDKIKLEAGRMAEMLRTAEYAIAFTGAGISTCAGIGDFRGKAGKWTEEDRAKIQGENVKRKRPKSFSYEAMRPTYTHEALVKLLDMGYLKHIISQNTDGLHQLSGVPRDKLSELHGNSFHEKCEKCAARYERSFAVRRCVGENVPARVCLHCYIDHRTGRMCERKGCDGYLMNTIINFGDSLEKPVLSNAEEHAKRNDLVLCLGSSMRVTPACDLVEAGQHPVRLAICNRQPTPFDHLCYTPNSENTSFIGSRVFGDCDRLMNCLMTELLSEDEIAEWEQARDERLASYAEQR